MKATLGVRAVLVQSAVQATAGMLALALMAPFFGPVLDHHFAERFPHHGHIYVASAGPGHVHPYAVPHHHHDDGHSHVHADAAAVAGSEASMPAVLFFVSNDGMTQAPMSLVVPPVTHDLTPPVPEDRGSPFAAARGRRAYGRRGSPARRRPPESLSLPHLPSLPNGRLLRAGQRVSFVEREGARRAAAGRRAHQVRRRFE